MNYLYGKRNFKFKCVDQSTVITLVSMAEVNKNNLMTNQLTICLLVGSDDNRASTQSSFTHVTTNTWAYSQYLDFSDFFLDEKRCPPPTKSHFENTTGNPFFHFLEY